MVLPSIRMSRTVHFLLLLGVCVGCGVPFLKAPDLPTNIFGALLPSLLIYLLGSGIQSRMDEQKAATATDSVSAASHKVPNRVKFSYIRDLMSDIFIFIYRDKGPFEKKIFALPAAREAFQKGFSIFFVSSIAHSIVEISQGGIIALFGIFMAVISIVSWHEMKTSLLFCFNTVNDFFCRENHANKLREKPCKHVDMEDPPEYPH